MKGKLHRDYSLKILKHVKDKCGLLTADVETIMNVFEDLVEVQQEYSGDLMCGRCYRTVDELFPPSCAEKPEFLTHAPIGQYHCPDCGAMLLAGVPHPHLCGLCNDHRHPSFHGYNPIAKPKES